ncbi:hypothetical protein P7H16_21660 [Paenibacillus larvae]|nr:hypothetical protein [Paenibacillus larvae]
MSRFTYALDTLAWNYQKLFVVAVGNDGEAPSPYNRVQAPADLVNGLGVGAYTFNYDTAERIRSQLQLYCDGREGCKVKPDVCAFGGDSRRYPIHLINSSDSKENCFLLAQVIRLQLYQVRQRENFRKV